jgi:hypothetical protein
LVCTKEGSSEKVIFEYNDEESPLVRIDTLTQNRVKKICYPTSEELVIVIEIAFTKEKSEAKTQWEIDQQLKKENEEIENRKKLALDKEEQLRKSFINKHFEVWNLIKENDPVFKWWEKHLQTRNPVVNYTKYNFSGLLIGKPWTKKEVNEKDLLKLEYRSEYEYFDFELSYSIGGELKASHN